MAGCPRPAQEEGRHQAEGQEHPPQVRNHLQLMAAGGGTVIFLEGCSSWLVVSYSGMGSGCQVGREGVSDRVQLGGIREEVGKWIQSK